MKINEIFLNFLIVFLSTRMRNTILYHPTKKIFLYVSESVTIPKTHLIKELIKKTKKKERDGKKNSQFYAS